MTALIFDCDGVLADTERDGHLPAFNQMFEEFGLPVRGPKTSTAEKLTIAGGKERMRQPADRRVRPASRPAHRCRGPASDCRRLAPPQDRDLHGDGRRGQVAGATGRGADRRRRRATPVGRSPSRPRPRSRPFAPCWQHVVGPGTAAGSRPRRRRRTEEEAGARHLRARARAARRRTRRVDRDRGLPQRPARGRPAPASRALVTVSSYTARRGLLRGGARRVVARRPGRRARPRCSRRTASGRPEPYVTSGRSAALFDRSDVHGSMTERGGVDG